MVGLIFISLSISACGGGEENNPSVLTEEKIPLDKVRLNLSSGCEDLKEYLKSSIEKTLLIPGFAFTTNGDGGFSTGSTASISSAQSSPDDVSQTNVQEAGVDEADMVKADSEGFLYVVRKNYFIIEQGFPPKDLKEISQLDLKSFARSLYLNEKAKHVVVLAQTIFPPEGEEHLYPPTPFPGSQLIFIDVSDRNSPRLMERFFLDSRIISSRRVENRIHLVSRFYPQLPQAIRDDEAFWDLLSDYYEEFFGGQPERTEELKEEIKTILHKVIDSTDIEAFLPKAISQMNGENKILSLLTCSNFFRPTVEIIPHILMVTSINTDGSNPSSVGIMNNEWGNVYSSKENLYLAQTSRGWLWNERQATQTAIYKFGISEDKPTYLASGIIDGFVRNQFSLSEYKGFLRVATNQLFRNQDTDRIEQTNHLFVLEDDRSGTLTLAGEVRDFGVGERIFSSRFMEDRGFVVTFRAIDPLFTFDLSDPYQPVLVGELEIPGFSTYIHPFDQNHLLTVGRMEGNTQLQIFDVEDLANPKLLHKLIPNDNAFSFSSAEFDHLAFNFYAPRNLLVIPLVSWEGKVKFSGLVAFRVTITEGFNELGRVDHADLAYQAYCSNIDPLINSFIKMEKS